ncbi:hypothetical protein DPSP01_008348 [Paraphaeosphaeria sporulosa]|uniref:Ricin B lectin domain-containing protein n=1 Tax=Paraphaeosphaeria sporulosa TaxID=1460663 RepID=A0A177CLC7_9PLEO|nr:uncharacterized protein CC84DRAFT_1162057 [Paraphaeosphaeria sporulosa]OAG08041.1 hypothetical protein CC84DRAFT_1162057 [Paraphaeosphaeria sporulosa]
MKFSILLMIAATASAAVVAPRHHKGRKGGNAAAQQGQAAQTGNGATQNAQTGGQATSGGNNNQAATGGGALARGATTIVLKETQGVPGNECITFRNNGEMVDAACVNTAADRQLQASTVNGQPVLAVQRSFTAGFRPDLVGVDACVGNNGTTFLALPCNSASLDPVTFSNNNLVAASGACQSGHDGAAQITVDQSGQNCAELTSTETAATPP